MTSADGFFFDFGSPASATTAAAPAPPTSSGVEPVVADIPLSIFPWVQLDGPTRAPWLAEWGSRYPPAQPASGKGKTTSTRPLRLYLTTTESAAPLTVCYQTAPELPALTHADTTTVDEDHKREARDIIKGKYYGGLKVWSCAPDLCQYLAEHVADVREQLNGSSSAEPVIAEVGCGQGLPALTAMTLGVRRLIFLDYNEEVLETCTRPNVAATVIAAQPASDTSSPARLTPQVQFVCGDWIRLQWDPEIDPRGCDLILGADVTFDEEACAKLADLLGRWLKPQTGVAYIASKVYYFGTGGGAEELAAACGRRGLQSEVVKRMDADGGMHRVILRVRKL